VGVVVSSGVSILYGGCAQRSLMKGVFVNPWLQTGVLLIVGLLTAGGVLLAVHVLVEGTNRAKWWWQRFTWAADLALENSSVKRVVGLQVLTKLAQCNLAQDDEYLLLEVFPQRALNELFRDVPDPIYRTGGRDGSSRVTEEHIAAAQLQLVLDEKLGRQTPEAVRHIALLSGIGTVARKRTDPPACPSKTVTYEVANYCLPTRFGRTGPQVNRGQAFTTSHGAVAATPLDYPNRPQLCILGKCTATRFGRNQQTTLGKAIPTSHDAVVATPFDDPGRLDKATSPNRVLII
jgi:hypothetical protein